MKRNWIIFGAVSTVFASTIAGAVAQTPPDTAAPMASMPMQSPMAMGSMPNYKLLADKHLDYTELKAAKAKGLSDSQVATVAKISEETGQPFIDIVGAVLSGETFAHMAMKYGLPLANVMDVTDEQSKINDYMAAYETTGAMAMKNHGMSAGMMSQPMPMGADTTNMAPPRTMRAAPSMSPMTPAPSTMPMTPDTTTGAAQ